jgi:hypothetical protein
LTKYQRELNCFCGSASHFNIDKKQMRYKMIKKQKAICPLFSDVECPQGDNAAEACQVRLNGDYDPVAAGKDYLFMNCAIQRANEQKNHNEAKNDKS